ncbi:MAG: hypothetical protein E7474_12295 [Ruminococcaceae bacterium]|nr:hypothetical protein [Oscillospiraceae bacterium]
MQIRKSRRKTAEPVPLTKRSTEEELAWAAGSEKLRHRDPLYHVTENFQQTFDRIGQKHARDAVAAEEETREREREAERPGIRESLGLRDDTGLRSRVTAGSAGGEQKLWTGNTPSTMTRFSETAFQRGTMFGSVLNGTGKMMLVSCLKRSAGEGGPKRIQQKSVFGTGSQVRNIPGHSPDQMVFNRGFAKSALGVVVDTLRDARRVVDSMTEMAQGTGELSGAGDSETMRRMYPFLDVSRENELEAEYRQKLSACTDAREKPILQNALVQAQALKAKKAQMKNEFINKLRFISDRATETLAELEAPDTLDEITQSAFGEDMLAEMPIDAPDDVPEAEGGSENNAPDGAQDGPGKENNTEPEPDGGKPQAEQ